MEIKECQITIKRRYQGKSGAMPERLAGDSLVKLGFDERTATEEARRCLENNPCESCDLCRILCPDLCITRNAGTGQIEIDYDYCKGCGICVAICPRGSIKMVLEE